MKQILLKTWLIVVCLLMGAGTMWAADPVKCTSTSDLVAGSVYYISGADTYSSTATVMGLSTGGNNFPASTFGGTPCELTLGGDATNGWTFSYVDGSNTYYLDPSNATSNNYLKRNTSVTDYGKFTISFSNGAAVITSKGKSSRNIVRYNSSSSCYSCYSSGQGAVYLYKKATTPTVAYTVTFDAGSNGTCSTSSLAEASAGAGVTLPSCTGNTNYIFEGWSTSTTPTSADAGKAGDTYKPSSNCTLYAYYTYQAPSHNAKFFVNGQQYGETQSVAEGSAITFPAENPSIDDVVFIGWAESEISGTQDNAPTLVSSKDMGNADANFYAVFATASGEGGTEGYKNVTSLTTGKSYVFGAVKATASSTLADNTAIAAINFTSTSSWGSYATLTPNASGVIATNSITNNNLVWTLLSITDGAYVFKSGSNYLSLSTSTGASTAGVSTTSASVYIENVSSTCKNAFLMHPTSSSTNKLLCNTGNNYGYRMYGSSTNATLSMCPYIRFYEYDPGTTYTDYCTSVSTKATPTLSFENASYDATMGEDFTAPTLTNSEGVTVTYSSSETGVATVDSESGAVTLVGAGTTTITAFFAGDETYKAASASYTLNVSAAKHTVTIKTPENGTITVKDGETTISTGAQVAEGSTITLASTPNPGYKVASTPFVVTDEDGGNVSVSTAGGKYSFTMPEKNVTITAQFSPVYKITKGACEHGSINAIKDKDGFAITETSKGSKVVVEAEATDEHWTLDGMYYVKEGEDTQNEITESDGVYSFTMPQSNITVYAKFKEDEKYEVSWVVNGETVMTENLYADVAVSAPEVDGLDGKVFRGWVNEEIDGTTDTEPSFVNVSNLTVSENKAFYAVFANASEGGEGTVQFDVTTISGIQQSIAPRTQTTDGVTFTFSSVGSINSNSTVQMSKSSTLTQNVAFAGNIKSISFEGFSYSSTSDASMLVEGKKGTDGTYATVQSCGSSYTGAEISFGSNEYDFFKITVGSGRTVKFTKMIVEYSGVTYSDYCTSINIVPDFTLTISDAGYATYYNAFAYKMPENVVGKIMVNENGVVKSRLVFEAGDVVPVETPLLLKGPKGEYALVKTNEEVTKSAEGNLLRGSHEKAMTIGGNEGAKYYKFSNGDNGYGWYYGSKANTTGEAFENGAHKAYLVVDCDVAQSARFISIEEDSVLTEIDSMNADVEKDNVYDLQGRRVQRVSNGMYIKNGKKVIF